MHIHYSDIDAFHDGILAMVTRGLTFRADAQTLVITLLGGH